MNGESVVSCNNRQLAGENPNLDSPLSTSDSKIGLILLAAGASRRMGNYPKQLLEFHGESLLRRAAQTALNAVCRPVCVVLGANAERLRIEIADLPVEIAENKSWESGISSSLKTGLRKLLEVEPQVTAACVMLSDQPLIDSRIINCMIEAFKRGENLIVASRYAKTVGVPAIFARRLFDELMSLSGDAGAKKIIRRHFANTLEISVPEAALDVDSSLDYERLMLHFHRLTDGNA